MKELRNFKDLIDWQKARVLTAKIYSITSKEFFAKDYGLKDQIRRAFVSIMSNIAEGFERGRPTEFHQFLSIAKASCAEVRSQLYVALDVGYVEQTEFNELMTQATEVGRILGGLRAFVEKNRG